MSGYANDEGEDAHDCALALQELSRVCEGCRERSFVAAESVRDPRLSCMLAQRAEQWRRLGEVLRSRKQAVPEERLTSTRIRGSLHRALIKIKSALDDDQAIAGSCAQQEATALGVFLKKMESGVLQSLYPGLRESISALLYVELAATDPPLRQALAVTGAETHQN